MILENYQFLWLSSVNNDKNLEFSLKIVKFY